MCVQIFWQLNYNFNWYPFKISTNLTQNAMSHPVVGLASPLRDPPVPRPHSGGIGQEEEVEFARLKSRMAGRYNHGSERESRWPYCIRFLVRSSQLTHFPGKIGKPLSP